MKKVLALFLVLGALFASLLISHPDTFGTSFNQSNLWRHISLLAIFAIGEGFVIIVGGIDLSVGALIGFTGMLCAKMMVHWGFSPWLAVPAVLLFSILIGAIHGQLITRLKLPSFIVTLTSMMIFQGLSLLLNGAARIPLGEDYPGFREFGKGNVSIGIGEIPIPLLILLGVAAVSSFLLYKTVLGQYLLAVGSNEEAARYSGIHSDRVTRFAFIYSSVLAGVAGLLYAGYLTAPSPNAGMTYELYAIAAAVLGGCSLTGGEGNILGIVLGAAIMRTLNNGITLLGIPSIHEKWIIGAVILAAAILDVLIKTKRKPDP